MSNGAGRFYIRQPEVIPSGGYGEEFRNLFRRRRHQYMTYPSNSLQNNPFTYLFLQALQSRSDPSKLYDPFMLYYQWYNNPFAFLFGGNPFWSFLGGGTSGGKVDDPIARIPPSPHPPVPLPEARPPESIGPIDWSKIRDYPGGWF